MICNQCGYQAADSDRICPCCGNTLYLNLQQSYNRGINYIPQQQNYTQTGFAAQDSASRSYGAYPSTMGGTQSMTQPSDAGSRSTIQAREYEQSALDSLADIKPLTPQTDSFFFGPAADYGTPNQNAFSMQSQESAQSRAYPQYLPRLQPVNNLYDGAAFAQQRSQLPQHPQQIQRAQSVQQSQLIQQIPQQLQQSQPAQQIPSVQQLQQMQRPQQSIIQQPQQIQQSQPMTQQPQRIQQPQPMTQQPQRIQQPQPMIQQPQQIQQSQSMTQQPQRIQQSQPMIQQPQQIQQSQPMMQQPQQLQRPQIPQQVQPVQQMPIMQRQQAVVNPQQDFYNQNQLSPFLQNFNQITQKPERYDQSYRPQAMQNGLYGRNTQLTQQPAYQGQYNIMQRQQIISPENKMPLVQNINTPRYNVSGDTGRIYFSKEEMETGKANTEPVNTKSEKDWIPWLIVLIVVLVIIIGLLLGYYLNTDIPFTLENVWNFYRNLFTGLFDVPSGGA